VYQTTGHGAENANAISIKAILDTDITSALQERAHRRVAFVQQKRESAALHADAASATKADSAP